MKCFLAYVHVVMRVIDTPDRRLGDAIAAFGERRRSMNIVLCHGILGFRTFLGVNYFNGVKAHIEAKYPAVKVLVPQVNPVAAADERGGQLQDQIVQALGDTGMPPTLDPGQKTHILAHSMGGLDARYMLSPANPANIG